MKVHTFLLQGPGDKLTNQLQKSVTEPCNALVIMSLGADHNVLCQAVQETIGVHHCPVYLTETFGILGYDEETQANIELMEKDRGSEYGFAGGSGGQGCLVIAYSGGDVVAGHDRRQGSISDSFLQGTSSLMVITNNPNEEFSKVAHEAPIHYGGLTKESWLLEEKECDSSIHLEPVPYFWVAKVTTAADTIDDDIHKIKDDLLGISAFTGEADKSTEELLSKVPKGYTPMDTVGLFPCFTRGINQYGEENVETTKIIETFQDKGLTKPRIYGMFAHGELGPPLKFANFVGVDNDKSQEETCKQHSGTSVLVLHAQKNQ